MFIEEFTLNLVLGGNLTQGFRILLVLNPRRVERCDGFDRQLIN